jgi:hypothetical protein
VKDATADAARNQRHIGKARVYTAEDVVQLREERERGLIMKKRPKSKSAKIRLQLK